MAPILALDLAKSVIQITRELSRAAARMAPQAMAEADAYPSDLLYNREHQWLRIDGDLARTGITRFGQEQLGDIVVVYLPRIGDRFKAGERLLDIESTKVLWELYMPVSGEIVEVNTNLDVTPELVNQEPHGLGWLAVIRFADATELESFFDAAAYAAFLASGSTQ